MCHRNVRLQSGQHLNVNFNPSALLSFGDALAFFNTLMDVDFNDPGFMRQPGTLGRPATVSSPENAPLLAEQMAQKGGITARVPQKYMIQNQSGLRLYYWGEEVSGSLMWAAVQSTHPYLSQAQGHRDMAAVVRGISCSLLEALVSIEAVCRLYKMGR